MNEQAVTDAPNAEFREAIAKDYEWGFSSDIEQEFAPKGLSEDTVRFISAKKNEPEWMLEWRLKAYRAWLDGQDFTPAYRHLEFMLQLLLQPFQRF